jgi:hypothetical protein
VKLGVKFDLLLLLLNQVPAKFDFCLQHLSM